MTSLLAGLCALLAAGIGWPLVAGRQATRLVWITVNAAFLYWYWVPAINVLGIGYLGPEDVTPDRAVAAEAVWQLLAYQLAALGVLTGLARLPAVATAPYRQTLPVLPGALFALAGAAIVMVWMFADQGLGVLLRLATGAVSARELRVFDNFSASATDSLRALLEALATFASLIVLSDALLRRRLASAPALLSALALILAFVASGTRALLMMAVVCAILAAASGARVASRPRGALQWLVVALAGVALIVPVALTLLARAAFAVEETNPLMDLLFINNDMFRELVFVMDQMRGYAGSSTAIDFVMVPFTYVLPSFLGFSKAIPDHLLVFNGARAGIDLILGAGNVFPGLIADFLLTYRGTGPLWFGLFIAAFTLALRLLERVSPAPPVAVQIAVCAYLFFSFRNLHPALVLVIVVSFLGLVVLHFDKRTKAGMQPRPDNGANRQVASLD